MYQGLLMSQVMWYVRNQGSVTFLFKADSWWFPGTPLLFQLRFACLRLSSVFEESSWQDVHTVMMLTLFWCIVKNVLLSSSFWNADRFAAGKEKIIFCLVCLFLNSAISWFNTWQEYFFFFKWEINGAGSLFQNWLLKSTLFSWVSTLGRILLY